MYYSAALTLLVARANLANKLLEKPAMTPKSIIKKLPNQTYTQREAVLRKHKREHKRKSSSVKRINSKQSLELFLARSCDLEIMSLMH